MKVKDLIEKLKEMPEDAEVFHLWDGAARTIINHVWLSRSGNVITADSGEVCYQTETRPIDAPTEREDRYWSTPQDEDADPF